jgi:transposase
MQEKNLKLKKEKIGALPIIEVILSRMGLRTILKAYIPHDRYLDAVELLIKNVLCDHTAIYRIKEWAGSFDPSLIYGGSLNDDAIGRALDKLFAIDRSTFQTKLVLSVIKEFNIKTEVLHNDSTTIKLFGNYNAVGNKRAVAPKRGHSKDHRPDLKQVLYTLTVSNDFAVPVHYKPYDGNRTDDTTHIETWKSLRSMLMTADFIYVADSKLCTTENMMEIDREKGKFITIVPGTRAETKEFAELTYGSAVRWQHLLKIKCSRKTGKFDVFEQATDLFQLKEGFAVYWYRSSEKQERDANSRQSRIDAALEQLNLLQYDEGKRGPKTEKGALSSSERILKRYKVENWVSVSAKVQEEEYFRQVDRGQPSKDTKYRRCVRKRFQLHVTLNHEAIKKAKAMDGIFPLTTNTTLTSKEVLLHYKYQPKLEKRFNLLKTVLSAAPVFLNKPERIEALTLVYFISQLVSALIERVIKKEMIKRDIEGLHILPEERLSANPTWDLVRGLFDDHDRSTLYTNDCFVKTFSDALTDTQRQILNFVGVPEKIYR